MPLADRNVFFNRERIVWLVDNLNKKAVWRNQKYFSVDFSYASCTDFVVWKYVIVFFNFEKSEFIHDA